MLKSSRIVRIGWGDCDPKAIVYYPRYFEIFEACTVHCFEQALAMSHAQILESYDLSGFAVLSTQARFLVSASFGDDLVVETSVAQWHLTQFDLCHRMLKGDVLAVEAFVTRAWMSRDPRCGPYGAPIPRAVPVRFGHTEA